MLLKNFLKKPFEYGMANISKILYLIIAFYNASYLLTSRFTPLGGSIGR